jgi:hypothetical protein
VSSDGGQLVHANALNAKLTDAVTQMNETIRQLHLRVGEAEEKASRYASELKVSSERLNILRCERDAESATQMERNEKFKEALEKAQAELQAERESKNSCEERYERILSRSMHVQNEIHSQSYTFQNKFDYC